MSEQNTMQFLYRRAAVYHFYQRVPEELVPHYGKRHLRHSLHAKDVHEAKRLRNFELVRTDREFQALLAGEPVPISTATSSATIAAEISVYQ